MQAMKSTPRFRNHARTLLLPLTGILAPLGASSCVFGGADDTEFVESHSVHSVGIQSVSTEEAELLQRSDTSFASRTSILRNTSGEISSVVGFFRASPNQRDGHSEPPSISVALRTLLRDHAALFGIDENDVDSFHKLRTIHKYGNRFVSKFDQRTNSGVPYLDRGIAVVHDQESNIVSITGYVRPVVATTREHQKSAEEAISFWYDQDIHSASSLSNKDANTWGVQTQTGSVTIKKRIDPVEGDPLWILASTTRTLVARETIDGLETLEDRSGAAPLNKPVNLGRRTFPQVPNSNPNLPSEPNIFSTGSRTPAYVLANQYPTHCQYMAGYDASHGINRVIDARWSQVSVNYSCSSTPNFPVETNFSFSNYREADTLFWLRKARSFALDKVFYYFSGESQWDIDVAVGGYAVPSADPEDNECPEGAAGCYYPAARKMIIVDLASPSDPGNYTLPVIFHEYGHDFSHKFDGFLSRQICSSNGSDESRKTVEFVADSFAQIMMPEYFDEDDLGYVYQSGLSYHLDGSGFQYSTSSCVGAADRSDGEKLSQMIREIIWDINCEEEGLSVCEAITASEIQTLNDADSVGWAALSDARKWTARAIASAAFDVPDNAPYTMNSFILNMAVFFDDHLSSSTSSNIVDIFEHHGFSGF